VYGIRILDDNDAKNEATFSDLRKIQVLVWKE
jgi:hypothetical protein